MSALSSRSSDANLKRKRALADALAGVAGSIVSLWTFYPIEVWKTNLQAGLSSDKRSLFQGFFVKTLHTASSNFCYFYLYSWIFANWKQRHAGSDLRVSTRLFLSAVAAMLNTLVTLPLDVLSSQQVTQNRGISDNEDEKDDKNQMEQVWDDSNGAACAEESKAEKHSQNQVPSQLSRYTDKLKMYAFLWKGLTPSLLLCSNPAINYTVFDTAKKALTTRGGRTGTSLSMPEAFLLGLFAKFVATIATYPLIRAKVMLMVTSENSMLASLIRSYKDGGARGLYKGCDWQLLHTVLKSALMMMIREKIAISTQRLIVGNPTKPQR